MNEILRYAQDDRRFLFPSLVILSEAKNLKKKPMNYFVYILTNKSNRVMYIGVTNDLQRRLYEHRHDLVEGFTKKYHVHKLVYFEQTNDIRAAIAREKQLKGWLRAKKNALVESVNPEWRDLSETW